MRLKGNNLSNNETGFTAVELLVTLAIMVFVIAGIYSFFSFTQNSYVYADAQSEVSQEATLFFSRIEKDIRNAAEPNTTTKAINIVSGQQIDIYQFDNGKYSRICYRRNPDNEMILERGFISTDAQDTDLNPEYGTIVNWETVVANLVRGEADIFLDRSDTISSRRLIEIDLILQHPKMMTAYHMTTSVLSRSGRSTDSIEASGGSYSAYIPVTGIEFVKKPGPLTNAGGTGVEISAKVIPDEATNKNLIWSQEVLSLTWLSFPEYSLSYEDDTGSNIEGFLEGLPNLNNLGYWDMITTRSESTALLDVKKYETYGLPTWFLNIFGGLIPDPRETTIKVSSPDGPSATFVIKQNRDS